MSSPKGFLAVPSIKVALAAGARRADAVDLALARGAKEASGITSHLHSLTRLRPPILADNFTGS